MAKKEKPLANYSEVNFVDLWETRAVRHSKGASYGKKGARVYSGRSSSTQEWTNLGRGVFTLGVDKCYFIGGGQQRIIDRKKMIRMVHFTNDPGIEITVSNRQKSMRFMLPGRTIEDGRRLQNAIADGKTSVVLTELTSNPGRCYVATSIYGSYDCPEVWTLRRFRDNTLDKNIFGRLFIKSYYATSPTIVKYFGDKKIFNKIFKPILDRFVKKLNEKGVKSTFYRGN